MKQDIEKLFHHWCNKPNELRPEQQAQLLLMGLDVDSLTKPVNPIDAEKIQAAINFSDVQSVFSTESTQKHVKPSSTLIAEHQSAGVGQRGKNWLTPLGLSVCLSHRFILNVPLDQMAGFTLTVALACLQSIQHFAPEAAVTIKWPNDLYCQGVKFAGILTHAQPVNHNQTDVTLGIGINWQLSAQHFAQIDQNVCNIPLNTKTINRNDFIIELLKQIQLNNQQFTQHGCSAFLAQWQKYDQLHQQKISLRTASANYVGEYAGINAKGEIKLNINGELHCFASGEALLLKNHV